MRFFSVNTPFGVAPLSFEGYWLCAGWSFLIWGYNRQRVKEFGQIKCRYDGL